MPTVRPIASFALSLLVAIECWMWEASASSVRTVANETGIGISVHADGSFEVTTRTPAWKFSGNVGSPLAHLASRRGRDRAGPYREVEFKYETSVAAARLGAIRIYDHRPVVIFKLVYLTAGKTSESFPTISSYPRNLHHLTYTDTFGGFSFERFGPDGPGSSLTTRPVHSFSHQLPIT